MQLHAEVAQVAAEITQHLPCESRPWMPMPTATCHMPIDDACKKPGRLETEAMPTAICHTPVDDAGKEPGRLEAKANRRTTRRGAV